MAEDPGVGTLSAVIEAMRQLFNFVQDTAKSIVNTGADIARTYLYMSWRKNSMGARAKHGEQSLKKLRRQEAQGATIKTVEIGKDFEAMLALEDELKNLKVDFAITQTSTGEWLLHYKQSNEPDVIRAQQYALTSNPSHDRDPSGSTTLTDAIRYSGAVHGSTSARTRRRGSGNSK